MRLRLSHFAAPLAVAGVLALAPAAHAATAAHAADPTDIATCYGSGSRWWCSNYAHVPVFCEPDYTNIEICGWLDSTVSWFQCRVDNGRPRTAHGYTSRRYLYTQGDEVAAGHEGRHGWGWVSDADIYSNTDPVRVCG